MMAQTHFRGSLLCLKFAPKLFSFGFLWQELSSPQLFHPWDSRFQERFSTWCTSCAWCFKKFSWLPLYILETFLVVSRQSVRQVMRRRWFLLPVPALGRNRRFSGLGGQRVSLVWCPRLAQSCWSSDVRLLANIDIQPWVLYPSFVLSLRAIPTFETFKSCFLLSFIFHLRYLGLACPWLSWQQG